MTLHIVTSCQRTAVVSPGTATTSQVAPVFHCDTFGFVMPRALEQLYGRPVAVSPLFVKEVGNLEFPTTPHQVFIPSSVEEGVKIFLRANQISYTEVSSHQALRDGSGALALGVSAVMLFCPPAILSPELESLIQKLTELGFMRDGVVQSIDTWQRGIAFIKALVESLPNGWDLIDACELFDFGPWESTKGIIASLRCMGMRGIRKDDTETTSRTGVLGHPIHNRAAIFDMLMSCERETVADLFDFKKMKRSAERLIVEFVFITSYLSHRVGLTRFVQEKNRSIVYEISRQLEVILQVLNKIIIFREDLSEDLTPLVSYKDEVTLMLNKLHTLFKGAEAESPEQFISLISTVWRLK